MPFAELASDNSYLIGNTFAILPDRLYDPVAGLRGRETEFAAGANLFTQGSREPGDDTFYVIVKGAVDIVRVERNGAEEIQARVGGRGAIVGEIAALKAIPRARTVRTAGSVVAIALCHNDLMQWNGAPNPWGEIHAFITRLAQSRLESLSKRDRQMFGLDDYQWGSQDANVIVEPVEEAPPPPTSIIPRLSELTGEGALVRRIVRGRLPSLDTPPPPTWFRGHRK